MTLNHKNDMRNDFLTSKTYGKVELHMIVGFLVKRLDCACEFSMFSWVDLDI